MLRIILTAGLRKDWWMVEARLEEGRPFRR